MMRRSLAVRKAVAERWAEANIEAMSRAFVKEDAGADALDDLPDRAISPHPNLVTPEGLAAIEAELERLHAEAAGIGDDPVARAHNARDLRYWGARRANTQIVEPPPDAAEVRFGSTVTVVRDDGRRQTFRIVGEDEADPERGTLSYVAPLARALMGKGEGETVRLGAGEVEIAAIR